MIDPSATLEALASLLAPRIKQLLFPEGLHRPAEKPLTLDELAEYTGISRSTLAEMARRRQIPCYRAGKRVIFIASEVLEALRIPANTKGGAV